MIQRFTRLLLLGVIFLSTVSASAYDARIDDIYYNLNTGARTASVTYKSYYSTNNNDAYIGSISIPSTISYGGTTYSVTSIEKAAFMYCRNLNYVDIPNSVTSIESNVFFRSGIRSITIPSSVTKFEANFAQCQYLTSVVVEDGNTVYDSREGCNAIIETASNTLIAGSKKTIIPSSVTRIGSRAFSDCYGPVESDFASIDIPNSVMSIGERAFENCLNLRSINIPNSVTSIGEYAFSGCNILTSVTIPRSVTSIGGSAFCCSNLREVICLAKTVPTASSSTFSTTSSAKLYVPAKSLDLYKTTSPWSSFGTIEAYYEMCAAPVITFENGEIVAVSETEGSVCHIECKLVTDNLDGEDRVTPSIKLVVTAYATAEDCEQSATTTLEIDLMNYASGDINGDGKISVEDITKIVQKALAK